jgi:hypothetical protein
MTIAASRNQPRIGSWSVNFSAVVPVKHWRAANAGMELPLRAESAPCLIVFPSDPPRSGAAGLSATQARRREGMGRKRANLKGLTCSLTTPLFSQRPERTPGVMPPRQDED